MKRDMTGRAVHVLFAAGACLTLVALMHVASARAQAPPSASGVSAGAVAAGRVMFTRAGCDTCHGQEGGGIAPAPRIAGSALPLSAFTAYVRRPTGSMPAFGAQVASDQNLADIYAFLRSVAAPAQPGQAAMVKAGRVDVGATLYRKVGCYSCHVNEGQGGANGPRLGPDPIPFVRFTSYVRNPSGDMPPYTAKVLSDTDLADIYAFLAARPRPPALGSIPSLAP